MTAEQFLALANALRSYAHHSGRDVNAAHMFVHAMLMRAVRYDAVEAPNVESRSAPLPWSLRTHPRVGRSGEPGGLLMRQLR
jgi:hypothetical protein